MGKSKADVRKRNFNHGDNHIKPRPIHNHNTHSDSGFSTWSKLLIISVLVAVVSIPAVFFYKSYLKNLVRTPLVSPKILDANSSSAAVTPERFWGSYRPQAYFGLKTRSPRSPILGLMWLTQFTREMPAPIRHWCDEGDHLSKYGWLQHDGMNFGVQGIEDRYFKMTTEFVKRSGGEHGGEWTARINVQSKIEQPVVVSLMFYIALDGQGSLEPTVKKGRLETVHGNTEELGSFELHFLKSQANTVKYDYLVTYANQLDKLKDNVMGGLKIEAWDKARTMPYFSLEGRKLPKDAPGANFIVHQVTATVPFSMEVVFESGSVLNRAESMSGPVFSQELAKSVKAFDERFERTFGLREKGFQEDEVKFAQAALSNMVGSIGYFYGSSLVKSKYNEEPVTYWDAPLYSGVPSRPFFPRGFLWDEGFHNLLISQWDVDISIDIISHWLDLLNTEGWIPREQILGAEARAKVPSEFVVQKNENANPPTFFLPLQKIVNKLINEKNLAKNKNFLEHLFPRLQAWYNWYNTTQLGEKTGTYRWRGRDGKIITQLNPMTLTSGLDDYPRASHPTDHEFHVDLRCWMTLASHVMADLANALNHKGSVYDSTYDFLRDNQRLDELHWSEAQGLYADYGLHTHAVKFHKPKQGEKPPPPGFTKYRIETQKPEYQLVNQFGYVSLFPFLLKVVDPSSPKLFKILTDLKNPGLLWTDYGLRSLAKNARLYNRSNTEHDPPYWRGAIWINMNYLALSALDFYAKIQGPYQATAKEVYTDLRKNIINNIINQYKKTGYIWEQYNDKTGDGMRSHPFTGWDKTSDFRPDFTIFNAPIRHWCDEGDHLSKYGWLQHDGMNFGVQGIEDRYFKMTTEFVKRSGGEHGGEWTARINVQSKIEQPVVVSLMFYIALDGQGSLEPTVKKGRLETVHGNTEELGSFELHFLKSQANTVKYDYLVTYANQLDKLKDNVMGGLKIEAWDKARTMPYFSLEGRKLPKDAPGANFIVHQVTATVPFSMEVVFESGSVLNRAESMSGPVFSQELAKSVKAFDERFERTFGLREKGFQEDEVKFAQAALSNMVGSIGYFYGSSLVKSKYNEEPVTYWDAPLYSGVPSRPFFPRGFLWDEGFHNLLISQWDVDISIDIISHWLDLLNTEGWIPREQILGAEARAKVPSEFVVQKNENANPPTFFLPLQKIVNKLINEKNLAKNKNFLEHLFPRLQAWYNWYNTTQLGEKTGTYRWRGRDGKIITQLNPMTLTSGLDDYPRASHPTDHEFHVDLRCWMTLASHVMADLANALNHKGSVYDSTYDFLRDNQRLDELHWSEAQGLYADYGLHTHAVKFHKPKQGEKPPPPGFTKYRIETQKPEYQLVNQFGYVSLFPFLLKVVDPSSPKLFKILTDLKNPGLLWTDYGLRSLAKNARLYNRSNTEHDPPYWRGAIWINMNYLALSALDFYAKIQGPYQATAKEVYTDLRKNIINNIINQYKKTGYIWEQYNDKTGDGMRSHPFTGWSALVVLIMSEKY